MARAVAAGFPHHLVQRGNNRQAVFFSKKDRQAYLSLLKAYAYKWECATLAYCLMENHVHLLAKPKKEESLYKMMQGVTLCYTQYINRTYQRTGRLWESRYYSCIVDKKNYLWTVARYIEDNPVRAGLVKRPEDFPYSSAKAHIEGIKENILGEELFEKGQEKDYANIFKTKIPDDEITILRKHLRSGRPLGSVSFIKRIENRLNRQFDLRGPGRPKKK